jgi:hypothetical protein
LGIKPTEVKDSGVKQRQILETSTIILKPMSQRNTRGIISVSRKVLVLIAKGKEILGMDFKRVERGKVDLSVID